MLLAVYTIQFPYWSLALRCMFVWLEVHISPSHLPYPPHKTILILATTTTTTATATLNSRDLFLGDAKSEHGRTASALCLWFVVGVGSQQTIKGVLWGEKSSEFHQFPLFTTLIYLLIDKFDMMVAWCMTCKQVALEKKTSLELSVVSISVFPYSKPLHTNTCERQYMLLTPKSLQTFTLLIWMFMYFWSQIVVPWTRYNESVRLLCLRAALNIHQQPPRGFEEAVTASVWCVEWAGL